MAVVINDLIDECLLEIFKHLDILDLASTTQVCKRWSQLTKSKLDEISEILLNDPYECPDNNPFDQPKMKTTNIRKIQSALKYLGPQVTSVKLGDCCKNTIFFEYHGYNIVDDFEPDNIVSILSQTCTNISQLHIGEQFIESKNLSQLLKFNKNLKKVILPENNLLHFPTCAFESVEEVTWSLTCPHTVEKFKMPFPNMKKLILIIRAPIHLIDVLVDIVLRHIKNIKSLTIFVHIDFSSEYELDMLSYISNLSQLQELIVNNTAMKPIVGFKHSSVKKLIKKCPNLRLLKFVHFGLGLIDVPSFLALPKLEILYVSTFSNFTIEAFSRIKLKNVKKLAKIDFHFSENTPLNVSGLIDFVGKLPALKKLVVLNLPAEKSFELTCKMITSQLARHKEILIKSDSSQPYVKIYKTEEPKVKREQVFFLSRAQAEDYQDRVLDFVQSLGGCSVGEQEHEMEVFEWIYNDDGYIDDECGCMYGYYDFE